MSHQRVCNAVVSPALLRAEAVRQTAGDRPALQTSVSVTNLDPFLLLGLARGRIPVGNHPYFGEMLVLALMTVVRS